MRTDIRFTYAEYRTLPETGPRYQLVDGGLLMSPAPNVRHQKIAARLFKALDRHADAGGLGIVLFAPLDVILSAEDVLQPDVVFISRGRMSIVAPEGIRGAPDLCVEILSPASRELDIGAKRILYARHGVVELWAVDPDANTVAVYRLQEDSRKPARQWARDETLTTGLLPGFSLPLPGVLAP